MANKSLCDFDVDGELKATSLDVNGAADISGNVLLGNSNILTLDSGMNTAGNFDAAKLRLDSLDTVDNTGFHGMRFATSTTNNFGWSLGANRSSSGRGSLRFYEHNASNAGDERFTLLQDGNVGIGVSAPSAKLDVNGGVQATSLDINGAADISGNATLGGIIMDGNTVTGIDDSSEFTDDDAHIMTSAAINDRFATYNWVNSRGENLFSNGSGLLGDITNMPGFTFDGSHANNSPGSFKWTGTGTPNTSEFIPVDASRKYKMQYDAKTENGVGRYYGFTSCFDVDGIAINSHNHMYRANTLTTLAVELVNGATTITLTDSANWNNAGTAGTSNHLRSLIIWNYANSFGYTYPEETYSRNYTSQAWDPGDINFTTHVITLRVAWAGGTIAAGTKVSNGSAGGTYKYNVMSSKLLTTDWVRQEGYMDGVDYSGTNNSSKFPPGTAKIKLGWLMNYQNLQEGEVAWFTNINVGVAAHEDDEIAEAVERATDSNTFTDADHTKLNAIEAGATADQTVTDSTSTTSSTTVASATAVKAAYDRGSTGVTDAASAQTTANAALPKVGGTMSGAIAMGNQNITGANNITAASLRCSNIVTNKVVKFDGTQLNDANITDTGSLITLGSNTVVSGELEATSLDINGNADISGDLTGVDTLTATTLSVTNYGLASGDIPNNAADTTGNADTATLAADATTLATPRAIFGQNFDGSAAVTGNATLGGIVMDGNTITGIDDSSEFTNNDNHIMTSAAIEDKILSYGYTAYAGPEEAEEGTKGIVEIATEQEAIDGEESVVKAVTPFGVLASFAARKVHQLAAPTAALAMNSQKVTGVANPTAAQDAATKAYTDAKTWNWNDITAGTAPTFNQNTTGSAATLTTPRAINGVDFNGSAAITIPTRACFEFKGYGTADGTNYEMGELMTVSTAPFNHDTSTGYNGLTAQTIQTIMRSGGTVMPYAGTLKKFTGWVTSAANNPAQTVDVGIFKVTPTDDAAGDLTPSLLVNAQTTASGNNITNSFSETPSSIAFSAGDIIYSAVKGGTDDKAWYFTSTLEVQWT
jgi:cytoskeletal protein CcmA (bactofilin family)